MVASRHALEGEVVIMDRPGESLVFDVGCEVKQLSVSAGGVTDGKISSVDIHHLILKG